MQKKQPDPSSRKDLAALIAQGQHYAAHMMETVGSIPPTLMALTPEGFMMLVPNAMSGEKAKDSFANAGRLLAVGYTATAVAMILESWATFAKRPGEPLPNIAPSQSPDREEVVMVMGEARDARAQQILLIQRDSQGRFCGFGTKMLPQFDSLRGRFAQMMPAKEPSAQEALMARLLLEKSGVTVANAGFNPSWN